MWQVSCLHFLPQCPNGSMHRLTTRVAVKFCLFIPVSLCLKGLQHITVCTECRNIRDVSETVQYVVDFLPHTMVPEHNDVYSRVNFV